ncbi:alpha/beta hydrolase family protein [Chlamydiifrater phoenicopteri]|uniref:alpha/beta hydrolase family protein n=1 Tax=Chlamydiifrater phoenicopteri TaxID=2681469 RepID=UPI001BCB5DAD|nr:alpha/beta hydrolase [Chlamydiifrater phoenicopteri]
MMFSSWLSLLISALIVVPSFTFGESRASLPGVPADLITINPLPEEVAHYEKRYPFSLESGQKTLIGVYHKPLTTPPPAGFPAVILFHGFRGSKIGHGSSYIRVATSLSKRGIAVFRVDLAGCGDSEGLPEAVPLTEYMQNCEDIVNKIAEHPDIDINRMGLAGFSYGCHLALAIAKKYDQKLINVKAISIWAPIADGTLLFKELLDKVRVDNPGNSNNNNLDQLVSLCKEFGFLSFPLILMEGDIGILCSIHDYILINHLKPSTKILHLQGEKDLIISDQQRRIFIYGSPKNVSFVHFPETGHGFGGSPHEKAITETIASHFEESL